MSNLLLHRQNLCLYKKIPPPPPPSSYFIPAIIILFFALYRLTRRRIENEVLLEKPNLFREANDNFLSKKEFADLLNVQETDNDFQELFQMYSVSVRVNISIFTCDLTCLQKVYSPLCPSQAFLTTYYAMSYKFLVR